MSLVLVCESPPYLRLDVADGETGLDVANAGIHGIKGGWRAKTKEVHKNVYVLWSGKYALARLGS